MVLAYEKGIKKKSAGSVYMDTCIYSAEQKYKDDEINTVKLRL